MTYTTTSKTQTLALGKKIAKKLKGGEVIALTGELGAGKTTLIQGIAKGLDITKHVTSPTFLIMRVYHLTVPKKRSTLRAKGLTTFVHIDCYRIKTPQTLKAIGALEYFGRPDTVVAIEWAEKVKRLLPRQTWNIALELKDRRRTVTLPKHLSVKIK